MAGILVDDTVAERKARRQVVDADIMLAELARHRPRERRHRPLRGHIMRELGDAASDGARADIDDLAVFLRDHVRRDVLGHQKDATHIDRHDAIPKRSVDLGELLFLKHRKQRGVIDQDVDLAEAVHGLRHQRLDRGLIAHVGDGAFDRIGAMLARQLLRDRLAVGDIGDHQPRALRGKRPRIMPANALGAAGQDRHAAV